MSPWCLSLLLLAFLASPMTASEVTMDGPTLVKKSEAALDRATATKTVMDKGDSSVAGYQQTIWRRRNADGTTDTRIESSTSASTGVVSLTNREGTWTLVGDVAIKRAFAGSNVKDDPVVRFFRSFSAKPGNTYTVSEASLGDVACYRVDEHISEQNQKDGAAQLELIAKSFGASLGKDAARSTIALQRYWIRKSDMMPFGEEWFTATGDVALRSVAKSVEVLPSAPADLFEVPDRLTRKTAKTAEEEVSLLLAAGKKP